MVLCRYCQVLPGIAKYHQVLILFNILVGCSKFLSKYCWYCQVLSGIVRYCQVLSGITRYREGSKKHLDDPVPNGDFLVLHCLGIGSSVLGIRSDHIGKYMSTI